MTASDSERSRTVARYFKYRSLEDLEADAARRGLEIEFARDLAPLFEPLRVGPFIVGSRLVIHPMEGCDGTLDGRPDELTLRRWRRFGAGGAKIVWGEATAVVEEGRANKRQLWLHAGTAKAFEKMLADCRAAHRTACGSDRDLIVGLQLTHSGRYCWQRPMPAVRDAVLDPLTVGPSAVSRQPSLLSDKPAVPPAAFHSPTRPLAYSLLSDDDLERLEDAYVAAARLAFDVGFDFVDLKQCHRYLLSELLAARTRPGRYGGSFENRTRFVTNAIRKIQAEVPHAVIATRMNAYDGIPYRKGADNVGEPCPHELPLETAFGTDPYDHRREDLAEPIRLVRLLAGLGVAMVSVSMGNPYANMHVIRPFEHPPVDGYETPEHPLEGVARHFRIARAIREAVGEGVYAGHADPSPHPGPPPQGARERAPAMVVIGGGYSWLQDYFPQAAAANLARGHVDAVGVGRAALPYPDFARSLQGTSRLDRRRVCRTFSYCTALMRAKHNELGQFATGCPPFDKEVYGPIWQEAKRGPNE